MFKFFGLLLISISFTNLAIGYQEVDIPSEIQGERSDSDCFFDFFATSQRTFDNQRDIESWCQGIDRFFRGQRRSCNIRRGRDGRWHGRFSHQRRFTGRTFQGIFDSYRQFADQHLFRGFQFQHHFQFPRTCFGRGGGGYPID